MSSRVAGQTFPLHDLLKPPLDAARERSGISLSRVPLRGKKSGQTSRKPYEGAVVSTPGRQSVATPTLRKRCRCDQWRRSRAGEEGRPTALHFIPERCN